MPLLNTSDTIALLALLLAFTTTIGAVILSYIQSEKKKYAAERDFNHLKRNIQQLTESIRYQSKEFEDNFEQLQRDILEIKMYLGTQKLSDRPSGSPWQPRPNNHD